MARGRELWLPVAIWIGGIFLLVPAGRMLNKLFSRAIGREGLRWLLIAAGAALIARALFVVMTRVKPARGALGVVCVAAYAGTMAWSSLPEEMSHPLLYTPLALLLERALANGWTPWPRAGLALLISLLVAVADEGLQHAMPGRVFDPVDVRLDLAGAFLPLLFLRVTGLEIRPVEGLTSEATELHPETPRSG